MLKNILKLNTSIRCFCSNKSLETITPKANVVINSRHIQPDIIDFNANEEKPSSPLEKCDEDISHIAPYLKPSFNFAAYANKSKTINQFVNLGVELYKLEKNEEIPKFLLGLDFVRDVQPHILYLFDLGLQTEDVGKFITKNPFIFKEDLETLEVRINYLKSKRFNNEMITRIVSANPLWLQYSTNEIDKLLGYFQKKYQLTGSEVRKLATKAPKLITYPEKNLKVSDFALREEMGFNEYELKRMILDTPKILIRKQEELLKTFEYLHQTMKLPLETISKTPNILLCRQFRLKQRHEFLKFLGKVQFDPKQPLYIAPQTIVEGSDAEFATNVAGSTIQTYNNFLKTM